MNFTGETLSGLLSTLRLKSEPEYERALELAQKALTIDPSDDWTLAEKGWIESKLGAEKEAIESFSKAIEINASKGFYHYSITFPFLDADDVEPALSAINEAIALEPNSVKFLARRSQILLRDNKPKRAIKSAVKAITSEPDYIDGYIRKAFAEKELGEIALAIRTLQTGLDKARPSNRIHYELARVYSDDEQWVLAN